MSVMQYIVIYKFIACDPLIQLLYNLIYQLELLSNFNLSFAYSY